MKDLTFSGGDLTTSVTFRVDSISGVSNLTVMESYGLNDRQPQPVDTDDEKGLLSAFRKLETNLDAFKAFAVANDLDLSIADTNGNNKEILVDYVAPVIP